MRNGKLIQGQQWKETLFFNLETWSGLQIIDYHPVDGCHNITGITTTSVKKTNIIRPTKVELIRNFK